MGLCEDAEGAPRCDEHSDSEQPVRTTSPELAGFAFWGLASAVLDDGVGIAKHHCQPKSKRHLLDQDAEVKELFHEPTLPRTRTEGSTYA
jgi:hypothetical protein